MPGSGASRGLTTQDLEASRTATWDDNVATMDDTEEDDAEGAPLTRISPKHYTLTSDHIECGGEPLCHVG